MSKEEGDPHFLAKARLSRPCGDPSGLLSAEVAYVHQASRLQQAGVPGVQHRTPNGVLPVAGAEVLPFEGVDPFYLWRKQDHLHCNGKY